VSAADPILQAIWAVCSHDDYAEDCDPCLMRKWMLVEHLEGMRA
jgi:hypothetical protein